MPISKYRKENDELKQRWQELRDYLQLCVDMAADAKGGGYSINYDKNTVLQILFKMDSMSE